MGLSFIYSVFMSNHENYNADRAFPSRRFNLSQEDLDEFKAIWKEEFSEEISDDRAREEATKLIALYRELARCELERRKQKRLGKGSNPAR